MRFLPWMWMSAKSLGLGAVASLVFLEVCKVNFLGPKPEHYAASFAIGGVLATLFGVGYGYRAGLKDAKSSDV
jgi:hypothetical protein